MRLGLAFERPGVAASLVVALAVAAYVPWIDHGFVMDDPAYIADNPAVTEGAPITAYLLDRSTIASDHDLAWQSWRPLRTLAFRAVARIGGPRPFAFGVANLLLYGVSIVLVLALLRRLRAAPGTAAVAAALWALAPVHVEPVLYAASLGDHLSLVLGLGTILLSLSALDAPAPSFGRAAAASGLLAAALLVKEMAVTVPLLVGLWSWTSGTWRSERRRTLALIAVQGGIVLAYLFARTAALGAFGHGALAARGFIDALALLPVRLLAYLEVAVAPIGHHPAYLLPRPPPALVLAAWGVVFATALWLRGRSQAVRLGVLWFAVALLPVLGLVPLYADIADRFALLPSVGLALAAPAALAALAARWRPFRALAPAALLAAYLAGTAVEASAWTDEATLWAKSVALEPASAQAHRNLGLVHLYRGDHARALAGLERARALGDGAPDGEYWRAMALRSLGRNDEAIAALERALARKPRLGRAHALLGSLLLSRGDLPGAERALEAARRLEPRHAYTLSLEMSLAHLGNDRAAELAVGERFVARYPQSAYSHYRLALALAAAGDVHAADSARACLRVDPGFAACSCLLGRALLDAGRAGPEAARALDAGLKELRPGPERDLCAGQRRRLLTH